MQTLRCEATLGWVDNPQCENTARILYDGRYYCHLHAALAAFKNNHEKLAPSCAGRCECTCTDGSFWEEKGRLLREAEGWRCKRLSSVRVDGVNMCSAHAKKIILAHMIRDGLAIPLPYEGPYKPMCDL